MSKEKDFRPECWQDDKRMNVLFSDFRAREVNPQAWDGKVEFWRNVIISWCKTTNKMRFTEADLKSAFERNGQIPQCLHTVINELLRLKVAGKTTDFGNLLDGNGWISWGVNVLLKKPLVWSLAAITNTVNKKEAPEQSYLLFDIIREKAEEVTRFHDKHVEYESTDHIINMSDLWEQLSGSFYSEADLEIVLIYLKKEKIISTYADEKSSVVKFRRKNEKYVTEITEIDLGILRLKKAREYMKIRISKLEDDALKCIQTAKQHLKLNERAQAKSSLRKKKMIEKVIAKREASLENLDLLLQQIQDSESEKMVIEAYKSGVASFRKTLAQGGITIGNVDDTMASIQEVFDMNEDIQDAISQSIGGETDVSELESELEELLVSANEPSEPPPVNPGGKREDNVTDEIAKKDGKLELEDIQLPDVPEFEGFDTKTKESFLNVN